VKQTVADLSRLFEEMFSRAREQPGQPKHGGLLAGADDEIDQLFAD
jgi:hypothetical protein